MDGDYKECRTKLGAQEKLIALNILLVIYLHDKRYPEAFKDINDLLGDPQMNGCRRYLLLKKAEISVAMAGR